MAAIKKAQEKGFQVYTNTTFFNTDSPETVQEILDDLNDDLKVDGMQISPGYAYEKAPYQVNFLSPRKSTEMFAQALRRGPALASSARMIPLREQTKLIAVTAINEVRLALRELGRRGVAAGYYAAPEDVMMLLESELDDYVADPARFAPVIAERLAQYLALFEIEPPFIIDADPAPLPSWPRRARPRPSWRRRVRSSTASAAAPGSTRAGPGSAWTCPPRWPWSRARSWSRRSPTPPGPRCSWSRARWRSTSAR